MTKRMRVTAAILTLTLTAGLPGRTRALNPAEGSTNTGQTLHVAITAPADGARINAAPGGVVVTGTASIGPLSDSGNVIYLVDVSGSTSAPAGRDCNGDGVVSPLDDINGDGSKGDTLDCEVAGVIALNASLASAPGAEAGLVLFGSAAAIADVSPEIGQQTFTSPLEADRDGNGQADIADVARSLRSNGTAGKFTYKMAGTGTSFDAALSALATAFAGRAGEHNFAFFLSDGQAALNTAPGSPLSQVVAAGIKVNTYSVGGFSTGCGTGANLRRIADATGGTCTAVSDPSMLTSVLVTPAAIDTVTVSLNGGAPAPAAYADGSWSLPVTALRAGEWNTLAATVTATDGSTATADLQVYGNQAPLVSAGGPYTVMEGSAVTLSGTAADPDGDGLAISWSASAQLTGSDTPTPTYMAAESGVQSLTMRATDPYGMRAESTTTVTVLNLAPTVSAVSAPTAPVAVGGTVSAGASFTDPGTLDTHTAVWNWGDGTTSTGAVSEAGGAGTVTGSHVYTAPGIYTVTLTLTDDEGGTRSVTFQYVVVYDPGEGFVTGGGWYDSAGGRTNFGFNARYRKGALTPEGQTEFQTAGLNFHSTAYEWLIINGSRATYKGSGTINGGGQYLFMLTVTDGGAADLLRMKIWDKATGAVVYDSLPGAPDDAEPATVLNSGSVVIH